MPARAFFQATLPLEQPAFEDGCRRLIAGLIETPGPWTTQGDLTTEGRNDLIQALEAAQPAHGHRRILMQALPAFGIDPVHLPSAWADIIRRTLNEAGDEPPFRPMRRPMALSIRPAAGWGALNLDVSPNGHLKLDRDAPTIEA